MFEKLDEDGNGWLTFEEVQQGLDLLKLPSNYAYSVFAQLDTDRDGKVRIEELATWSAEKDYDVREVFIGLDNEGDGFLNVEELQALLYELDLHADANELMTRLDKDRDGRLGYEEFRDGFALLAPADFSHVVDGWLEYAGDSDVGGVSGITGSTTQKKKVKPWQSAVAGAIGNAFSLSLIHI